MRSSDHWPCGWPRLSCWPGRCFNTLLLLLYNCRYRSPDSQSLSRLDFLRQSTLPNPLVKALWIPQVPLRSPQDAELREYPTGKETRDHLATSFSQSPLSPNSDTFWSCWTARWAWQSNKQLNSPIRLFCSTSWSLMAVSIVRRTLAKYDPGHPI